MAILNKEEFMNRLKQRIGESTSEEDLRFLEDMTDTYKSLEKETNIDWKEKYENLDNEWRERYKERFFSGKDDEPQESETHTETDGDAYTPEDVKLEDSFLSSTENVDGNVVTI